MNQIDNYVNEVLEYSIADRDMKERIANDLSLQLEEAAIPESIDDVRQIILAIPHALVYYL